MRRLGRLALAIALVVVAVYVAISWRYADDLTRVFRDPLKRTPAYVAPVHEDVTFRSRDGVLLKGWWFPATRADRAVVMVHGKDQNRIDSSFDPGRIAHFLLADGWSVLVFEMRGHGESEGLRWGLGEHEPNDILSAIDLAAAKAQIDRRRVATIGESMGAGSVLMTVGRDPSIGPIVVDSAYESARTVIDEVGPDYSHLPAFFTPGMVLMGRLFFDIDIGGIVPIDVVRAHPERAFLFIQCENDRTVAAHHGIDLRRASANARSELWLVKECGHVLAFATHPDEWREHVLAFLHREIGN